MAVGTRLALPIGAVNDLLPQLRRHLPFDLVDRSRRQSQIDRASGFVAKPGAVGRSRVSVLLHIRESPVHDGGKFVDVSGLEAGEPVLRQANQRLRRPLMRANLAREGGPEKTV